MRNRKPKPMQGKIFGRWTVISFVDIRNYEARWLCRCICGNEKVVPGGTLRAGESRSCGCLYHESNKGKRQTHGLTGSITYKTWEQILQRCRNPNNRNYPRWGGRGIGISERWLKFENFIADMGPRPAGASIERIDNSGNYQPGNCKWATATEQARNRRTSRMIEGFGETKSMAAWVDDSRCRVSGTTFVGRIARGWSIEMALSLAPISNGGVRKKGKFGYDK